MTSFEIFVTFCILVLGTVFTRFLPYILFPRQEAIPSIVLYLGKVLAPAVFSLLVVYCLRDVDFLHRNHGIPEMIAVAVTIGVYIWRKKMMLPMVCGTVCYIICMKIF